jgi:hypothetical protein
MKRRNAAVQRNTKEQRPGNLNSTQKMTVRLALATGATVVMLMGAQTLALFDQNLQANPNSAIIQQNQANNFSDDSGNFDLSSQDDVNGSDVVGQQQSLFNQGQNFSIQSSAFQPGPVSRSSR